MVILILSCMVNAKTSKRAGVYLGYSFGQNRVNTGISFNTEINTYNFGFFYELSLDKGRGLSLALNVQRLVLSRTSHYPAGEVTARNWGLNAADFSINYLLHDKKLEKIGLEAEIGIGWRFSPAAIIGNIALGVRFPLRMEKTRVQVMIFFRPVGMHKEDNTTYNMSSCWGLKFVFDYNL